MSSKLYSPSQRDVWRNPKNILFHFSNALNLLGYKSLKKPSWQTARESHPIAIYALAMTKKIGCLHFVRLLKGEAADALLLRCDNFSKGIWSWFEVQHVSWIDDGKESLANFLIRKKLSQIKQKAYEGMVILVEIKNAGTINVVVLADQINDYLPQGGGVVIIGTKGRKDISVSYLIQTVSPTVSGENTPIEVTLPDDLELLKGAPGLIKLLQVAPNKEFQSVYIGKDYSSPF